jgi:hypothetical protein
MPSIITDKTIILDMLIAILLQMVYGKTETRITYINTLIGKYTLNSDMNLALTIRHYWVMQTITEFYLTR